MCNAAYKMERSDLKTRAEMDILDTILAPNGHMLHRIAVYRQVRDGQEHAVLFDPWSVKALREYNRGDVVAIKSPYDSKLLVKRIVALHGDKIKTLPSYPDPEVKIPEGYAWVEGDEPFKSEDSNHFGPIPLALIDSKLTFIVWPWNRIGPLRKPSLPNPKAQRGPAWRA
ncbi:unnamed protein product [Somion occarium]|uniref:Mitochondrial inner membrane protease subunit 2 n=1 Tax=Somion occarium TaxID=3059160 RepID=A0ABP1D0H7_9APHY